MVPRPPRERTPGAARDALGLRGDLGVPDAPEFRERYADQLRRIVRRLAP
ncbi:hypothetical protein [Streptomyces sp. S465]|nr:hypothetical protein [Streptomyces sp. S465]WAP57758.1 hypothetical protein N6H00_23895 [Streptomyces sp. S465]